MTTTTGQCNRSRGMTRRTTHAYPFRLVRDNSFEQEAIEITHFDRHFAGLNRTITEAASCADPTLIRDMRRTARDAKNTFYDGNLAEAEELFEEVARLAMNGDLAGAFDSCLEEANYYGELFRRGVISAFIVHDRWQHRNSYVKYLLPPDFDVPGFESEIILPPIP